MKWREDLRTSLVDALSAHAPHKLANVAQLVAQCPSRHDARELVLLARNKYGLEQQGACEDDPWALTEEELDSSDDGSAIDSLHDAVQASLSQIARGTSVKCVVLRPAALE